MPVISLAKPPEPFSCRICAQEAFRTKDGPTCEACPAYRGTHYFARAVGMEGGVNTGVVAADVLFVGDVPEEPPHLQLVRVEGYDSMAAPPHETFSDDGGKVVRNAARKLQQEKQFASLRCRFTYAVKCAVRNPSGKVIDACQTPLREELARIQAARRQAGMTAPLVIIAHGLVGLRAVGLRIHSARDALGRVFENLEFAGAVVHVVASQSLKEVAASPGKFNSLCADVERAFRLAANDAIPLLSREQLEPAYLFPKTIPEVRDLITMLRQYAGSVQDPLKWALSFDTETNTLRPHRKDAKIILASFSWDTGKACAIPLWHKECPYDPTAAWGYVRNLLVSNKPFILHNAKFDLRMVWSMGADIPVIAWDCLLAEHLLEEDKRGHYSLKFLTKNYVPSYAGYENPLHKVRDAQEKEDDEVVEAAAQVSAPIPAVFQAALDRLELSARFRVSTLEKHLAEWGAELFPPVDKITDARMLLAAKKAGEFKRVALTVAKEERDEGFANIPLGDLQFYAAADADVTRQLSIVQAQRMRAEEKRIDTIREMVLRDHKQDPIAARKYSTARLCTQRNPLREITRSRSLPLMRALARIEQEGVTVDRTYLRDADTRLGTIVNQAEEAIYKLSGEAFKINNGAKLSHYLFSAGVGFLHPDPAKAEALAKKYPEKVAWDGTRIRYEPGAFTLLGAMQTTEKVLKAFVSKYECPLSNQVLLFRKAVKAKNTFLRGIDKLSTLDGRIHANYNQIGTNSGRLSSSKPNMQNVPNGEMGGIPVTDPRATTLTRAECEGVFCKRLFVTDDDSMVFAHGDAKGAELVVCTAYSKDAQLAGALREGRDMHGFFASKILVPEQIASGLSGNDRRLALEKAGIDDEHAWSYEDFAHRNRLEDKEYARRLEKLRTNVKRVVFGILYGAGARKIAEIAGIEEQFAQTIIDLLFRLFPSIPMFIDQTKWELAKFGFVETYFGRRRRFLIEKGPKKLMAQAERRAVNFKIQSTSSDIVLDTLATMAPVVERDMGGRILLTVHDSIGLQVPKQYASQVPALFQREGTDRTSKLCPWLPVPYRWDVEMGPSYGQHEAAAKYLQTLSSELQGYVDEDVMGDLRTAALLDETA